MKYIPVCSKFPGFHPVDLYELKNLEKLLQAKLPRATQILNIIRLKLQGRFTAETPVDFYLYRRNKSVQDDDCDYTDPFLFCFQQPNIWSNCGVFVLAPVELDPDQMMAFESIIPWSLSPMFCAVHQDFFENYLSKMCNKYAEIYSIPNLMTQKGMPCDQNTVHPSTAIEFSEPFHEMSGTMERIELRSVSVADVEEMVKHYKFAKDFSRRQMELCLENMTSCGLYVDGVLACSALLSPVGLINALHTDIKFRRRGFGTIVMREMARKVSAMGLIPLAENEVWNMASKYTQFKAGFQQIGLTNWVGLNNVDN